MEYKLNAKPYIIEGGDMELFTKEFAPMGYEIIGHNKAALQKEGERVITHGNYYLYLMVGMIVENKEGVQFRVESSRGVIFRRLNDNQLFYIRSGDLIELKIINLKDNITLDELFYDVSSVIDYMSYTDIYRELDRTSVFITPSVSGMFIDTDGKLRIISNGKMYTGFATYSITIPNNHCINYCNGYIDLYSKSINLEKDLYMDLENGNILEPITETDKLKVFCNLLVNKITKLKKSTLQDNRLLKINDTPIQEYVIDVLKKAGVNIDFAQEVVQPIVL